MNELNSEQSTGCPQKIPRLWTSNFISICLVSLFNSMAFHGLNVSLPLYIDRLGGSTSLAGLAMAILTAAAVVIRPFTGLALDKYGRRLILAGGLLLFLIPSLAFVFMVPFSLLLILRFVQGIGWGIFHTTAGTVASDIVPTVRLGEGMGTYNVTGTIGSSLAPLLSFWLINQFSFRDFFILIFVLTAASLFLSLAVRYPQVEPFPKELKTELSTKGALRPAFMVMLLASAHSSILSFFALFAQERGINNPGLFFVFMGVTALFSRPLSGKLLDRLGNRGYNLAVISAVPLVTIAFWIVITSNAFWHLAVSGLIFGIGIGTFQSTMLAMIIKMLPGRNGSANAIYGTFLDSGIAVGAVLWGIVAKFFGYQVMFGFATVPVLLCLVIYFVKRDKDIFGNDKGHV